MTKNKLREIQSVLHENESGLHSIIKKAHRLEQFNQRLTQHIDSDIDIRAHCCVANYANGVLTIMIDSAAWAARLRLQTIQLLENLQADQFFHDLIDIKYRVSTTPAPQENLPTKIHRKMSENSANRLNQAAESIDDPGIRAVLQKLAAHREK